MPRTSRRAALALAIGAVLASAACDRTSPPTDTGYTGLWMRGNERVQSFIAISDRPDGYGFRWAARSSDGQYRTDCTDDGVCVEMSGGKLVGEYRFRPFVDPETDELMVECEGVTFGDPRVDVHYVDRLELEPDGLALWSYVELRSGRTFEGDLRPKRRFEKISDDPGRLPEGWLESSGVAP